MCFARLIWANLLIQDETVAKMWLSNDRVGSNVTPRSLMDSDGKSSFPSSESLKSDSLRIIGRLPKIISFVFSGLSRRQLSKHQLRIIHGRSSEKEVQVGIVDLISYFCKIAWFHEISIASLSLLPCVFSFSSNHAQTLST